MNTAGFAQQITAELQKTVSLIDETQADKLAQEMLKAKKILVAGGGRSGFMAKSFVMRMMHMGLDAYVVGETVTPNLEAEDLFIVGSGSGETASLVAMAEKAKQIGAAVASVTTNPDSSIARLSDVHVKIPAQAKADSSGEKSIQPMGSLFEQSLLVFYDALILSAMDQKQLTSGKMYGRHANLE